MAAISIEVCKLCNVPMNDPRILPCAHSFCLECLESSTISKDSQKCPTCMIEFEMPRGGLKDMRKNEFVDRLNILKQLNILSVSCDGCKVNEAIQHCIECSYNYCSTCLEHHERIPTTINHRLLSHKEATKPARDKITVNKYATCEQHLEMKNLFCEDCRLVLCGHCLILKHKGHNLKHLSEHFDYAMSGFQDSLSFKKETLSKVTSNLVSSKRVKSFDEMKASELKMKIQRRGVVVKKAVDSIVAKLIKSVDEELKQRQNKADKVVTDLKFMEQCMSCDIKTLKDKIHNMSYANVSGAHIENVPNYSDGLNISLYFDAADVFKSLTKSFGHIGRVPNIKLDQRKRLDGNVHSFALYKSDVFTCSWNKPVFEVKQLFQSSSESLNSTAFSSLTKIGDMLITDGILFVSGTCDDSYCGIFKILIGSDNCEPLKIFRHPPLVMGFLLKMSKLFSGGGILVNLINKMLHLTTYGDVIKEIDLSFHVFDALQITESNYVVCCNDEVSVIDSKSDKLIRFAPTLAQNQKTISPHLLSKDNFGGIYVYDWVNEKLFALDYELNMKTSFDFKPLNYPCKICYDEERDVLVTLCKNNVLSTLKL